MAIESVENLKPGSLFTTNGNDVWEVVSIFSMPSLTINNLRTGEKMMGGVGCLNFERFVPLKPAEKLVPPPAANTGREP